MTKLSARKLTTCVSKMDVEPFSTLPYTISVPRICKNVRIPR